MLFVFTYNQKTNHVISLSLLIDFIFFVAKLTKKVSFSYNNVFLQINESKITPILLETGQIFAK